MISVLLRRASAGKFASLCLAVLLTIGLFPLSATAAAAPQEVVRGFYGTLLITMRQGPVLGQSGRYARLEPVVDRTFDIPLMSRLALGPTWGKLDPAQQQQITSAFAHYVAATYADRFDTYSGEQLQVSGERPYGADLIVQTKIVKSNGETTRLDYLVRQSEGSSRMFILTAQSASWRSTARNFPPSCGGRESRVSSRRSIARSTSCAAWPAPNLNRRARRRISITLLMVGLATIIN